PPKRGLGGLMQGLVRAASGATELQVLQAGPDVIVVNTLMGLRALDAKTGTVRWSATLPTARAGNPARRVQLYPSIDKPDRIYVSFDDRLMAYRLAYAELTPAGLLYISRPDPATNAEVNIIDLASGQPKFKDAIESGRPWGGNDQDYDAARYYLHHVVEGRTLFVFANRDHKLYAVDRDAGTFRPLGGEIKLQGGEDPTAMEIRTAGIVLISPQNLVVLGRDGQIKQQV